jgi:hypothetical protein
VLVARVVSPVSRRESWTVVGDDDRPLEPVERYLSYLTGIERSPAESSADAPTRAWPSLPSLALPTDARSQGVSLSGIGNPGHSRM